MSERLVRFLSRLMFGPLLPFNNGGEPTTMTNVADQERRRPDGWIERNGVIVRGGKTPSGNPPPPPRTQRTPPPPPPRTR